ncbi:MAG: hypothetical protein H8D96_19190 [Desulfobacterales bacterium]|uniref:Uncharacterized protein n=1 Tax=Candidatus Desulfatibia vada TaxID=2841696 RepID=A0A8J6P8V2_9BACT|nr:hypothetical protein [Candidatus Desulfatibia vada]
MPRVPTRKRPCRICRRWFLPNPRLKSRQMTCGDSCCKTEWHRKKCEEWNRRNPDYFKANYLQKKLEAAGHGAGTSKTPTAKSSPGKTLKSRMKTGLPLEYVQEVIGIQQLIIVEYLAQLLNRRFAKTMTQSFPASALQADQLPAMVFSRGDPTLMSCNH